MPNSVETTSPLTTGEKVYNFVIRSWTGVVITISSSVCLLHISDRAIEEIITDPKSAYNTNEAFRRFVQEKGWEPAIDLLKSWKGLSAADRGVLIENQLRKLRSGAHDPSQSIKVDEEPRDFFEEARETSR